MSAQQGIMEPSFLEHKGKYKGLFSWILSTDHKRIALLYMFSILSFFAIGATLGLLMKFELLAPGKTIMDAQKREIIMRQRKSDGAFQRIQLSF